MTKRDWVPYAIADDYESRKLVGCKTDERSWAR